MVRPRRTSATPSARSSPSRSGSSFIALSSSCVRGCARTPGATSVEIEGPAFTRFLFCNTRAGLFWLPIRLFLGFAWLEAGWHKLTRRRAGSTAAPPSQGFWTAAVAIPDAGHGAPITFEWYRDFLNLLLENNAYTWFAWLIVFGEIAVGLGLLSAS